MTDARSSENQTFLDTSFLFGANAVYLEDMAARYATDPGSVPASWRRFFDAVGDEAASSKRAAKGPGWKRAGWPRSANGEMITALGDIESAVPSLPEKVAARMGEAASPADVHSAVKDSISAIMIIRAYRMRGHLAADLDPLKLGEREPQPELDPESYGFGEADLDREIFINGYLGLETGTLREILDILQRTYCGTFGIEFMHISNPEEKAWLQERIEGPKIVENLILRLRPPVEVRRDFNRTHAELLELL